MKLKYIPFVLLLCGSMTHSSFAQRRSVTETSVLWKVSFPKSKKCTYLLGSLHVFGQTWVKSFPKLDSLIQNQELFIGENLFPLDTTAFTKFNDDLSTTKITARAVFKDKFDLVNNYFIKISGDGIEKNIDEDGNPISVIWRMYYYLISEVGSAHHLKISDADNSTMDAFMTRKAYAQKVKCIGLDSTEVLKSVTKSDSFMASLTNGIIEIIASNDAEVTNAKQTKNGEDLIGILSRYDKGKWKYSFNSTVNVNESAAKAVTRNKLWMRKLPALIEENNSFVVVGIGHLDGKNGLIRLLKEKGFDVIPETLL